METCYRFLYVVLCGKINVLINLLESAHGVLRERVRVLEIIATIKIDI